MQTKKGFWISQPVKCHCGGICPECKVAKEMRKSLAIKVPEEESFQEYLSRMAAGI